MTGRRRESGWTLGEVVVLVVLIVTLSLLIVVVIPSYHRRARSTAFRMTCGTNLSSIGKAMAIYANDYQDEFPRAGGPAGSWAVRTPNWEGQNRFEAYGIDPNSRNGGRASISASLYLLVKYMEVTPRTFVCVRGDPKARPFDLQQHGAAGKGLTDLWDFGPNPPRHVSYAYQQVFGPHRLKADGPARMAILADRNPWVDSPFARAKAFGEFEPDILPFNGTTAQGLHGNTSSHSGDGQNVLFLDNHAEFNKRSFCGISDDNIYTSWKDGDKVRGNPARFGSVPADPNDSLLVNDPATP